MQNRESNNGINMRNEYLCFWVQGKCIGAWNKQIAREPLLRRSRAICLLRVPSHSHEPVLKGILPYIRKLVFRLIFLRFLFKSPREGPGG